MLGGRIDFCPIGIGENLNGKKMMMQMSFSFNFNVFFNSYALNKIRVWPIFSY